MSTRIPLSVRRRSSSAKRTSGFEHRRNGAFGPHHQLSRGTGILTVRDLLGATPKRLLAISNFGEKTLGEVYAALEELGFYRPSRRPQQPR